MSAIIRDGSNEAALADSESGEFKGNAVPGIFENALVEAGKGEDFTISWLPVSVVWECQ